jgi:hypothetical protein
MFLAYFMAAFLAVFTFRGSGPAMFAHGSLDLKTRNLNSNSSLPIVQSQSFDADVTLCWFEKRHALPTFNLI